MALTCACGFTAFSQMIFEDHECRYTKIPEVVRAEEDKTSDIRISDAGLATLLASSRAKVEIPDKPISPPRPSGLRKLVSAWPSLEKSVEVAPPPPVDSAAEDKGDFVCICGRAFFSRLLFEDHKCEASSPEAVRASLEAGDATRMQDAGLLNNVPEEPPRPPTPPPSEPPEPEEVPEPPPEPIQPQVDEDDPSILRFMGRKGLCKTHPDIITEISVEPANESAFEAMVENTCILLREQCGKRRVAGCSCNPGPDSIQFVEAGRNLRRILLEQPREFNSLTYIDCLDEAQGERLGELLRKGGHARLWKHDSYGCSNHIIMFAGGHLIRRVIYGEAPGKSIAPRK
eukprot:TRINITY_DN105466_c0_g1_i1.p1 TRINITY_DN105466_c0_g1~~TRINITY_DN105466_c0_g1_i1.p1  ORF type:complete len:344 (-),score=70.72 TRINITY_DN105466_c0_g1_i1:30-1061(-)